MRVLPASMQDAFNDQQGVQLYLIVEIDWAGDGAIRYSTCEFPDVYAYVKEFSNFESVSHVEGLGSVSSINITFHDQFGHFKEIIDTLDIFSNTTATLYLTLDGVTLFDLFEGKISDNPTWSDKIFNMSIESIKIENEIGYVPSIDDVLESDPNYDFLDRHLNTQGSWPSVFGTFKNYLAPAIHQQRVAIVQEDVNYEAAGELYYELSVDQTDDFTLDSDYFVNIVGKEQNAFSILGYGQFKADNKFHLTKEGINSLWYQNIAFTFLDSTGISGEDEEPMTRIEIDPGSVTVGGDLLDTLGPDGLATTAVWLQFMRVEIRYSHTSGATTVHASRYANCVRQSGNVCYLNAAITLPETAYDIYIKTVHKAKDIIYRIPQNSQIYIMGDTVSYAVDTKAGTTVDEVKVKNGDEFITIDPAVYTVSSATLWTGTHSPVTYVTMSAEIYMRYLEFYAVKDKVNDGVYVTCSNDLLTDAEAIEEISGLTTEDDVATPTKFAYFSVEQAQDIIPDIAWQTNKAVRISRSGGSDIIQLIDLTDLETICHEFNSYNVLRNSVTYGFTSSDKVYTKFKADFQTNDHEIQLEKLRYSKNVDKYGEITLDVDYYVFENKADAVTSLQYWRDKLSKYYFTVSFTGFLDAFHLEVWDRIAVNLSDTVFYNPADGTPYDNTHTASPEDWMATGIVKSISPDLERGTIDFVVELDSISGVTPNPGYIIA